VTIVRIIPAVDILAGVAVRLLRGDYSRVTAYDDDPVNVAQEWLDGGASLVHVVDLEAARGGTRQSDVIARLTGRGIPVQLGGGIRTSQDARLAIDAGVQRVVIGSVLVSDEQETLAIVEEVGTDKVVAAIDVRGGRATGSGWLDEGMGLEGVLARVARVGISLALVTSIERDGTLEGPDLGLLERVRVASPGLALMASGGVGTLADIEDLTHRPDLVEAAIVGRALYEGRFTLSDAIAVADLP
jgi:phosphoribosylformimino-5-aminoimidazole carboxamide ribotide isomerase